MPKLFSKKSGGKSQKGLDSSADMDKVDEIVRRMKKKYAQSGVEFEKAGGRLDELRGIIAEGKAKEIEVQRVEDLADVRSPLISRLGKLYLNLRGLTNPLGKILQALPQTNKLGYNLYSANMTYSPKQWLALSTIVALVVLIISIAASGILSALGLISLGIAVLLPLFAFFFTAIIMIMVPRNRAKKRADAIGVELPFALRHMATELRAGIGLYRTLQTIASADYGVLSEEFSRTIREVEEGIDTKEALKHMGARTESKALKKAVTHISRALKTGGNLSQIMNEIAEDVSFELRNRMRDFAQKMNFFGVIFIFVGIVLPVFVAILGGIRNTPLSGLGDSFKSVPLTPVMLTLIYLVIMPMILLWLFVFIRMTQPKV